MAQGEFTKEEAKAAADALKEVMDGMPKSKLLGFFGHFNNIFLFLSAAENAAPAEADAGKKKK